MTARIVQVGKENQQQLYDYVTQYGPEHDNSYLAGRDFVINEEHPSYLLVEEDQAVGAVSLMRTSRFLSIDKGRFSIFHSILGTVDAYSKLLEAIRPHILDLEGVFLFIPEGKEGTARVLEELGFQIERYSFILERGGPALPDPEFPADISVQPLDSGDRHGQRQFADCINQEFKYLAGHSPSTAEFIRTYFSDPCYIENGVCLLKKGEEPIGTIIMMRDVDDPDAGEIMGFGVVEQHRGSGLGRSLFRYGFNFLIARGLSPIYLSVNGENHNAIRLYQSEGFQLTESVVCYNLKGGVQHPSV